MSLRDRLLRLLDRGHTQDPAPDVIVELEEVWLHEGPRLLQVLERAGIEARGVESTNVATEAAASNRMRIFVRYADLTRARTVLGDHRLPPADGVDYPRRDADSALRSDNEKGGR